MDPQLLIFDDLMSQVSFIIENVSCTQEFSDYVKWVNDNYVIENKKMEKEIETLKGKLSAVESEIVDKDRHLSYLKLQINKGSMEKKSLEKDRNNLRAKLKQVTNVLLEDSNGQIEDKTRAKISHITSTVDLNTPILYSGNHSIFSEISLSTGTVDDISDEMLSEESFLRRKKKPQIVYEQNSSDNASSHSLKGKRHATVDSFETSEEEFFSLGELSPRSKVQRVCFATDSIHKRPHSFVKYKSLIPHKCHVCSKLMSFQSESSKCEVCKLIAHDSCQSQVPLPCVPAPCTPTHLRKTISGKISAYTPFLPPMIPGLVIHCINAVENTGLNQECIYKFDGHPEQIKELLKELISEKKVKLESLLHRASIHSICSALKEFLLCLDEQLIPSSSWAWFVETLEENETRDVQSHLYAGIADLPQPNRDTLAYIMLHLQRVAESKSTKMTKRDLAQIFGPIIIGTDNTADSKPIQVFQHLLDLPADYWNQYIVVNGPVTPTMKDLRNTPTSDLALVQTINRRGLTTPYRTFTSEKKKYFKMPKY